VSGFSIIIHFLSTHAISFFLLWHVSREFGGLVCRVSLTKLEYVETNGVEIYHLFSNCYKIIFLYFSPHLEKMRLSSLLLASLSMASAWVVPNRSTMTHRQGHLAMALNYNDPIVAEEFATVQSLTWDDVEDELQENGIRAPPAMNEMDLKLMLVEVRLRKSGKLKQGNKQAPKTFSSKFEEAYYTKPAFEEFYNKLKAKDDHNAMNVVKEYLNNPTLAEQRYGKDYKGTLRQINKALTAPPPVNSTTIRFSGFPANMGEAGCRMTLEALGEVVEFECQESDDFPVLSGKVTFEDIESAKKAVEQYNGMDMGMGTKLELVSM
jgi:hypothetical protein